MTTGQLPRVPAGGTTSAGPARPSGWDWARHALTGTFLLMIAAALVTGTRSASLHQLEGALDSGAVHHIQVAGGLPRGVTGFATVQIRWRQGLLRQEANVLQVRGQTHAGASMDGVSAVVHGDIGTRLARSYPGLDVARAPRATWATWGASILGWTVPPWVSLLALAFTLGALVVLVCGPQPWRATRWAWFWLMSSPVTTLAFLVLSGPTPPLPAPRDTTRRLTGGWAFLLAIPLAAVLHPQ